MGTELIIIGAGNVGGFISYNIQEFGDFNVLGFLDDDESKIGDVLYGHRVLGKVSHIGDLILSKPNLEVVIGIASPLSKFNIFQRIKSIPIEFPNMIAKRSWVSKKVEFGRGVIIYPGVSINYECLIKDFVILNMNCAIGHNCIISDYSTLAPSVSLAGFTNLDRCVDMGINSSTIQGVSIGERTKVGGMAMVISSLPDNCTAVGVPAKCL